MINNKLKNAGFPFDWDRKCKNCEEEGSHFNCNEPTPTLHELIQACGRQFMSLRKVWNENGDITSWIAESDTQSVINTIGDTPEEAISELWLELQK